MRNVLRPLIPRMVPAVIESLQARGIAWLRYHDGMKRVRDIAEELAIEEERNAVIRELHRRRAVRDAAANAPAAVERGVAGRTAARSVGGRLLAAHHAC